MHKSAQFERAFKLLGTLLEQRGAKPISLVVCGGTALVALGLISRATRDADVVAYLSEGKIVPATRMPKPLEESARLVAQEMDLPGDWLNLGPASIFNDRLPNHGFPDGFIERLTRFDFGSSLSVFMVGRRDQVFFKLYAAADEGGPSRHFTDLVGLDPSDAELSAAARWARLHDGSPGFLETVRSMLRAMERYDVASGL